MKSRSFLRIGSLLGGFAVAAFLALRLGGGGLWEGLSPAIAANNAALALRSSAPYDLTQLRVVNEVLKTVRDRYVDPKRVRPKDMLLSSLNYVQRDVAQVIVLYDEGAPTVKVRVDTREKEFRVDSVQGPWDVSAKLREIFAFLQDGLRGTDVDLRELEYAACNGMLHTLDPHSVLLSPEAYKEMNLTTSGQFGGLGIVISIRDQQLTVIKPMPNTPAGRAGVKKYDRITKIDNESTLNMGLSEAVNRLRGAPGTKVKVFIHRDGPDGWAGARPFELTRETIQVQSVEHRALSSNVGYVRIKQFQANTSLDLERALADLRKHGPIKGLVLDLRGNPGGLLDQAARVSDKFLSDGPIVATVGNPSEGREEKVAHSEGTEPNYPLVLLVNGSSASASEIVAGALKNHDRAIIVGDTTFGKGSVQLVFNDLPDRAALKLTIAQYLTEPGDVSIQGVGITPDIELDPMTVDTLEMDLKRDANTIKERDLSRSLSNARAAEGQKPMETVRYALSIKDRLEMRERGGDPDDLFELDFPIRFAHDLVSKIPRAGRVDQVHAAESFVNETRAAELRKVIADLRGIGIDWSDAPEPLKKAKATDVPVEIKVETDRASNEVLAGEAITLKLSVTNKGKSPLYRLYGVTKSDNPLYDNRELVIGRLDPGKTRTATAPLGWCETEGHKIGSTAPVPKDARRKCTIPDHVLTRADGIKVQFDEAVGRDLKDAEVRVTVRAKDKPQFAYAFQIADDRGGNGDGRVQVGESLSMYLTVKNTGKGRSYDTQANLRNLSGDGLLLRDGRFDISNMKPGETRRVAFTFDVTDRLREPEAVVELSIADRDLRESVVEKVRMRVAPPLDVNAGSSPMRAKGGGAPLYESGDATSRVFARLPQGESAVAVGQVPGFVKLKLGSRRFAFAKLKDLEPGVAPKPTVKFDDVMGHAPPSVELAPTVLATRGDKTHVKGTAHDGERVLDTYIFVGNRKVFYRSNRKSNDAKHMSFETDVPLRPGVNVVSVVTRKNPETTTRKSFVVRRDGPHGELLTTPKLDDELAENAVPLDDD